MSRTWLPILANIYWFKSSWSDWFHIPALSILSDFISSPRNVFWWLALQFMWPNLWLNPSVVFCIPYPTMFFDFADCRFLVLPPYHVIWDSLQFAVCLLTVTVPNSEIKKWNSREFFWRGTQNSKNTDRNSDKETLRSIPVPHQVLIHPYVKNVSFIRLLILLDWVMILSD